MPRTLRVHVVGTTETPGAPSLALMASAPPRRSLVLDGVDAVAVLEPLSAATLRSAAPPVSATFTADVGDVGDVDDVGDVGDVADVADVVGVTGVAGVVEPVAPAALVALSAISVPNKSNNRLIESFQSNPS